MWHVKLADECAVALPCSAAGKNAFWWLLQLCQKKSSFLNCFCYFQICLHVFRTSLNHLYSAWAHSTPRVQFLEQMWPFCIILKHSTLAWQTNLTATKPILWKSSSLLSVMLQLCIRTLLTVCCFAVVWCDKVKYGKDGRPLASRDLDGQEVHQCLVLPWCWHSKGVISDSKEASASSAVWVGPQASAAAVLQEQAAEETQPQSLGGAEPHRRSSQTDAVGRDTRPVWALKFFQELLKLMLIKEKPPLVRGRDST